MLGWCIYNIIRVQTCLGNMRTLYNVRVCVCVYVYALLFVLFLFCFFMAAYLHKNLENPDFSQLGTGFSRKHGFSQRKLRISQITKDLRKPRVFSKQLNFLFF